jgi:hypothetical protein
MISHGVPFATPRKRDRRTEFAQVRAPRAFCRRQGVPDEPIVHDACSTGRELSRNWSCAKYLPILFFDASPRRVVQRRV